MENRLINIEMALSDLQKTVDELNEVVIEQGKTIEHLNKINRYILDNLDKTIVKPLEEETPPPHY
ncbi:MAG: SlyX family protein [Alphaproteobacteria bacterium]|nr:SlyX family protein [Alphaproteobacteria bacterium]